ncbi:hypothetical protein QMO14_17080 [Variovorax sp. CAN2819]|uniref:hypothetical protein n=1 Tax=Variovorax sp. CAN15 TaxID=3046727 RepID=UPI0026484440|nr:hypothetical protein [Variovorax sp. CAN15]MDN6885322.1 hypothetical protein [Variovorax sp. CAN15]
MSRFTQSNLSRRRDARRERAEGKRHPETVFQPTEEQALENDRALNAAKASPEYFAPSDLYMLSQQNRGVL